MPLRLNPGHTEMNSQVLFGELFAILGEEEGWMLVALDHDGSQGWVEKERIHILEEPDFHPSAYRIVSHPFISAIDLRLGQPLILPAGSLWPSEKEAKIELHGRVFELISSEGLEIPGNSTELYEVGKRLVSLPAIPGGRCGFGFDAPGLVQMLCRMKGIQVPRTSQAQSEMGRAINFIHEVNEGDLAFFDSAEGEINHVGVLLKGGNILHAHHHVRIDRFDQQGIYCTERDTYTHNLRLIKRIEN